MLVGSLKGDSQNRTAPVYNRAFLLNTQGEVVDYADKVHLVPFGEFSCPFRVSFSIWEGLRQKAVSSPTEQGTKYCGFRAATSHLGSLFATSPSFQKSPAH